MLSENINLLFSVFNCTNAEIAKYAGCDASHISRMRTGARTPSPENRSVQRLVDGIYGYCDNSNHFAQLCEMIGGEVDHNAETIKGALLSWLYGKKTKNPIKPVPRTPKNKSFRFFADKLDAVMGLLELSNVRLGKAIALDPSYISRFRCGVRTPKENSGFVGTICEYLIERTADLNKTAELCRLMNISVSSAKDEDYFKASFREWLCDKPNERSDYAAQQLLESMDSFSPDIKIPLPDFSVAAAEEIVSGKDEIYFGTEGMRNAVIRFLGNAAKNGACELRLYSDQSMSWLTADKSYRMKWLTLMAACVKSGVKIKIIHTIDRSASEMMSAIESWLPLYMSGMIEPYFCRRKTDGRFSHTLFLCPEMSCVEACHIAGCEETGAYNFYIDKQRLEMYEREYDALLAMCEPLIKIFTEVDSNGYMLLSERYSDNTGIIALLSAPSICSMPEDLLLSMLERNHVSAVEKERILAYRNNRKQMFERAVEESHFYELAPLPSDEDLYAGKVMLNLGSALCGVKISYTPTEYAEHIKAVIAQLDTHTSYRFYPLTEPPFSSMQLILDGGSVIAVKKNSPRVAFLFTNSMMYHAFSEYTDRLREQYMQDRNTVKQKLMKYL